VQLDKAKDYALRQLEIARETHNERLQVRALLYYALYLISIRKYSKARHLIDTQRAKAQELEEEQVQKVDALSKQNLL
jgi:diketogulonate reductase-like aldo/keto reductase